MPPRSRCLNDPAYRAIAAAVAIFGGLDHDVSFVFGSALFGCFGPGAQHDVWKGSVTDFVGIGCLYEQPRQHDQAGSSHVLLSSFPLCALKGWPKFRTFSVAPAASQHWQRILRPRRYKESAIPAIVVHLTRIGEISYENVACGYRLRDRTGFCLSGVRSSALLE